MYVYILSILYIYIHGASNYICMYLSYFFYIYIHCASKLYIYVSILSILCIYIVHHVYILSILYIYIVHQTIYVCIYLIYFIHLHKYIVNLDLVEKEISLPENIQCRKEKTRTSGSLKVSNWNIALEPESLKRDTIIF